MGLFDRFMEKKECGICGKELGLLGKAKLQDGYVCKDCARGLSPFFTGARGSSVEQIRQQLAYREQNRERVAAFRPTREVGSGWRLLVDDGMRAVIFTSDRNWRDANPDVIDFSQVGAASWRMDEDKSELYDRDSEGHRVSYRPPRYEYSYDFYLTVGVSSPYFSSIEFRVNDWVIKDRWDSRFHRSEELCDEFCRALRAVREAATEPGDTRAVAQAQPAAPTSSPVHTAMPSFCPSCGAPVSPGARFCESCGWRLGA